MISNDIKKIISALFLELAKSERSIDITRQVLSESTDFDAHQIFNYLATKIYKKGEKNNNYLNILKETHSFCLVLGDNSIIPIIYFHDKKKQKRFAQSIYCCTFPRENFIFIVLDLIARKCSGFSFENPLY